MIKRRPLRSLAKKLCGLQPTIHLLADSDDIEFTIKWVQKHYDEIAVHISQCEVALREHQLYEPLLVAFERSKEFAKTCNVEEADVALLEITRQLLEVSGQNDVWRKKHGFGPSSREKQ